jgi:hypothetical protein
MESAVRFFARSHLSRATTSWRGSSTPNTSVAARDRSRLPALLDAGAAVVDRLFGDPGSGGVTARTTSFELRRW